MKEHTSDAGWQGIHGLLLFTMMMAAPAVPALWLWPWLWVAPLTGYCLVVALAPPLRASLPRLRFGRVTPLGITSAALIAAVSCAVLIGFQTATHPDLRPLSRAIPVRALGGAVAAGICFSVLNASLEELFFRGVFFEAIASQWGPWVAVCGTAAFFGYCHLQGYPPGAAGAVLAGLYGFALGWLRIFTGGIGLPTLVHVTADATIFSILALFQPDFAKPG